MKRLISLDDLKKKGVSQVTVDGKDIVVVFKDDKVYAFDGFCPHQGGPLVKGQFNDCEVRCPWHGCMFNLKDGLCVDIGSCKNLSKADVWLNLCKIVVKDGEVFLE